MSRSGPFGRQSFERMPADRAPSLGSLGEHAKAGSFVESFICGYGSSLPVDHRGAVLIDTALHTTGQDE